MIPVAQDAGPTNTSSSPNPSSADPARIDAASETATPTGLEPSTPNSEAGASRSEFEAGIPASTSATSASSELGDASAPESGAWWKPAAGVSWQWQLSEPVDSALDVAVYDIDWETDPSDVAALHTLGIRVICYVSVGSWEDFRPDADAFPDAVIGRDYDGWPGEKYVDIRAPELRALMQARFDICKASGFDAIEPDNMDVFELGSDSGFQLTRQDGIEYAHWLASEAHGRGLGIGQKNAASITEEIVAEYDWALTESCYSDDDWCGDVADYVAQQKPVFMCEYEADTFPDACSEWQEQGFSPILKGMDLDAPVSFCP
ncbi:MAG TPA: endo alpha-1,4 polygalactosaminidase [Polyangiaceae bacterium]|jgi:hypothetical protein|nr:endo alpha-1,4 polygalactosaminidase [Polyangiaceae bacterium]